MTAAQSSTVHEASVADSQANLVPGETLGDELFVGNHAVLAPGDAHDDAVGRSSEDLCRYMRFNPTVDSRAPSLPDRRWANITPH